MRLCWANGDFCWSCLASKATPNETGPSTAAPLSKQNWANKERHWKTHLRCAFCKDVRTSLPDKHACLIGTITTVRFNPQSRTGSQERPYMWNSKELWQALAHTKNGDRAKPRLRRLRDSGIIWCPRLAAGPAPKNSGSGGVKDLFFVDWLTCGGPHPRSARSNRLTWRVKVVKIVDVFGHPDLGVCVCK